MSSVAPVDRYHALDSLRGFAMFLGVVLHAGISFMTQPPPFWPVRDNDPTALVDVFLLAVHDFRMQLFFLLAGFFGCLLYQRYGLAGLVKHRLRRVGIPFVLGLFLLVPTVQVVGVYCEVENIRSPESFRGEVSPLRPHVQELIDANPEAGSARLALDFFTGGRWLVSLPLIHLWFLYYLLWFVAATALLAPVFGRLTGTALLTRIDGAFRWVIESRSRVLILAALTFPLMLPMKWVADTPTTWSPQWHILAYYFAFFGFGWMLYRHRALVPSLGRWWGPNLILANVVVLPAMVGVIVGGVTEAKKGVDAFGWEIAGFATGVLYTWMMITGLWGAFLRLFSHERRWLRYMADSAYWCYLTSITPIVVFQFVVKDWPLPGLLKAVLVTAATMAVLLASYEWFVRYTFIGAILNGPKRRKRAEAAKPTAPAEVQPVRV